MNPNYLLDPKLVIPAQAGIQMIKKAAAKRDNTTALSASRDFYLCWIPACAGMTG